MRTPFEYQNTTLPQNALIAFFTREARRMEADLLTLPESPYRDQAMRALVELNMWTTKAITHGPQKE